MSDLFTQDFIFNALLVSILMGLLLAYLGVHVVGRGIVFVDLALGQISMLGVAFAVFLEQDPTFISILFTLVGAFLLSFIKVTDKRLTQEAIIGIIYAVASAATVLLISKSAHGDSDISEVLFGSLFTVTNTRIWSMAIVFGIIGVIHFVFRRQFFELTHKFARHDVSDVGTFNLWNFLFYLSIGFAIVLAVRAGGVIPVFAFLVVPSVSAILMTRGTSGLVLIAMALSVVASFFGVYFSIKFDFPAGPSTVSVLGVLFVIAALFRWMRHTNRDDGT
jgi:zinc/manganese transport system permease protein